MNLTSFNKATTKQKITTSSVFFAVVLCFVFYIAITTNIEKIKRLHIDIIAQKINLEKKINKDNDMSKLSSKIKNIEPEIKRLEKVFVDKSGQMEFITTIEGVAQQNNITQKINLSPIVDKEGKSYKTSKLQINSSGKLSDLMNYIRSLESMTYYIDIDNISFSSKQSDQVEDAEQIDLSIAATTYWK